MNYGIRDAIKEVAACNMYHGDDTSQTTVLHNHNHRVHSEGFTFHKIRFFCLGKLLYLSIAVVSPFQPFFAVVGL